MTVIGTLRKKLQSPLALEAMRSEPGPHASTPETREKLQKALQELQREVGVEDTQIQVRPSPGPSVSTEEKRQMWMDGQADLGQYGMAGTKPDGSEHFININPLTDRATFAHELGHIQSRTEPGFAKQVYELRNAINKNPQLKNAITTAVQFGPFAASALIPGSGDMLASLAMGLVPSTAMLADEANASLKGLNIMKKAGMPANLGQRTRLAGSLLSYAGNGLLYGLGGNVAGNVTAAGADALIKEALGAEDS